MAALGWIALWAAWVWISRYNHPSLAIDAAATAIMIAGSFALLYTYRKMLRPVRTTASALTWLLGVSVPVSLGAVLAIKTIYDIWVGPDPLRFSFLTNCALDWSFIVINLGIAAAAGWLARRMTPKGA